MGCHANHGGELMAGGGGGAGGVDVEINGGGQVDVPRLPF